MLSIAYGFAKLEIGSRCGVYAVAGECALHGQVIAGAVGDKGLRYAAHRAAKCVCKITHLMHELRHLQNE